MLGCDFESSGDMTGDELAGIGFGHEVIANAGTDESMLDIRQSIDRAVDIQEGSEILIEVLADRRLQARRSRTALADRHILAMHAVHICRRSSEVGDDAVEIRQTAQPLYLAEDRSLGARDDLLALMGRDSTERATAKTTAVHADRPLDHVVSRDAFVLVFGVRRILEGQIIDSVELLGRHRRVRRIDHHPSVTDRLDEGRLVDLIGLDLHEAEILRMGAFVLDGLLMGCEHDSVLRELGFVPCQIGRLGDGMKSRKSKVESRKSISYLGHGLLSHAIDQEVGTAIHKDRGHEFILPVVVMGKPPHGSLDAADDDRHIGIELLEDAAVGDGTVIGTRPCPTLGRISIVGTAAFGSRIMVDHRVHRTRRDRKIQPRATELLKIPKVPMPIRLRNDRYAIPRCLQHTPQDRRPERGVVDVRVAGEEDDVHFIPSAKVRFLLGSRQVF